MKVAVSFICGGVCALAGATAWVIWYLQKNGGLWR